MTVSTLFSPEHVRQIPHDSMESRTAEHISQIVWHESRPFFQLLLWTAGFIENTENVNFPVKAVDGSALLRRRTPYLLQTRFQCGVDIQAYFLSEVLWRKSWTYNTQE